MASPPSAPEVQVELEQVERYEYTGTFPGTPFPAVRVDEPAPMGQDRGPNPTRALALAVGHCMSSTLVNTLERAHVPAEPIRTRVSVEVGRNARGRLRVLALGVKIETAPLRPEDRDRFEHCVAIFEEFCTVSGAVREGIRVTAAVGPRDTG